MKPFHFDTSSKPLYGVYHPPSGKNQHSSGVLLCPPIGHEHMQTYWAFKQLAIRLSRLGFPVLRFDYYGTGNSSGDTKEGNISAWESNIRTAAEELQRLSGLNSLIIIGMRLGATLAARSSHDLKPDALVLWDPVVSGKQYFTELSDLHQAKLDYMHRKNESTAGFKGFDLLGYLYGEQLVAELEQLNLAEDTLDTIGDLTILADSNNAVHTHWIEQLKLKATPYKQLALEDTIDWQGLRSMEAAILPNKAINTLCAHLRGRP